MTYNHSTNQYEITTEHGTIVPRVHEFDFDTFMADNQEELFRIHNDQPVDMDDYVSILDVATLIFNTNNRNAPAYHNIVWAVNLDD